MTDTLTPFLDHEEGARDPEGHFEPFLIPRALMPQIDQSDYPELFAWLEAQSVGVEQDIFHPDELRLTGRHFDRMSFAEDRLREALKAYNFDYEGGDA